MVPIDSKPKIRRTWQFVAKAVVSLTLIVSLCRNLNTDELLSNFSQVRPEFVAVAVILTLALSILHAARWHIVLNAMNAHVSVLECLRLTLICYFFNQTLPSTVGGDAFRIWGVHQAGLKFSVAATSVVLDRVIALTALFIMIGAFAPWLFHIMNTRPAHLAIVGTLAVAAVGLLALGMFDRLSFASRMTWRAIVFARAFSASLRRVLLVCRYSVPALALSIVAHLGLAFVIFILVRGMHIEMRLFDCVLLLPLVTLITVLPLSIGGWGVREGAMIVALGFVGVSATSAFSLSVLYGLVILASGLPGAFVWLGSGKRVAGVSQQIARNDQR